MSIETRKNRHARRVCSFLLVFLVRYETEMTVIKEKREL